MTREQQKILNRGGLYHHAQVGCPCGENHAVATPLNQFNESLPRPLTEDSFNHLSLEDVKLLSSFNGHDRLVSLDSMNAIAKKGHMLNSVLEKIGAEKFINLYTK